MVDIPPFQPEWVTGIARTSIGGEDRELSGARRPLLLISVGARLLSDFLEVWNLEIGQKGRALTHRMQFRPDAAGI